MGREDLVSVIVPVYNVEQYLDTCIESLINQTYKNLEIILIDDGSADTSGNICDLWAERDNRIRVIHEKNGGPGAARNKGLNIAQGDYIAFLDSDDFYYQDSIEYLLNSIKKSGSDIVVGNLYPFTEKESEEPKQNGEISEKIISEEELWGLNEEASMIIVSPCNKLYSARLFEKTRFPEGVINEDTAILTGIYSQCKRVFVTNKFIFHYRIREGSITHASFSGKNLTLGTVYYGIMEYLMAKGYWNSIHSFFRDSTDLLIRATSRLDKKDHASWEKLNELIREYRVLFRKMRKGQVSRSIKCKCILFCSSPRLFFVVKKLGNIVNGKDTYC